MRIYKVHYVLAIKFGVSSRTNIIDVLAVRQWYIKKETIVTQDSWCSSLSEFPQAISSPNFPTQATRWTLHAPTRISIIKQITQNYKLSIQTSQLRVVSRERYNSELSVAYQSLWPIRRQVGGHVRRPPKARSIQPHGGLITCTVVLSIALRS